MGAKTSEMMTPAPRQQVWRQKQAPRYAVI